MNEPDDTLSYKILRDIAIASADLGDLGKSLAGHLGATDGVVQLLTAISTILWELLTSYATEEDIERLLDEAKQKVKSHRSGA
jgi:hypothetical protein